MNHEPTLRDLAPFGPFEYAGTRYHEYRKRWLAGERPENNGYFIRVKNSKPVSLVKKTNGKSRHLLGLDLQFFDREVWVCKEPYSPQLTVAIEWFQKKYKRQLPDLSQGTRVDIRQARKIGASVATLAKNYGITRKTVQEIIF